jgi:hypothetical protein
MRLGVYLDSVKGCCVHFIFIFCINFFFYGLLKTFIALRGPSANQVVIGTNNQKISVSLLLVDLSKTGRLA